MGTLKQYPREFEREALELARTSGKTQRQIEQDLGLYQGQLSVWKGRLAEDGAEAFPGTGNLKDSEAEVRRLLRKVEILEQERDILKKAIAIFSHPKA